MKKRTGFVSNSSSSSFIVGIGVVTDFNKFNNWMGKLSAEIAEDITLHDPVKERETRWPDLDEDFTSFSTEEPTNYGGTVSIRKEEYEKLKTERPDNIVILCIGNNEGDGAFYYDEDNDDYDLNYDIDLDWFDKNQIEAFNGFDESNGISLAEVSYGAGRNG